MRYLCILLTALFACLSANAVDFRLRDFDDNDFNISSVSTEYTLVFLYNSDCDVCSKGAKQIDESATVNAMMGQNRLTVVSVAMFEEADGWKRKAANFPTWWTNCSDAYDELLEGDALNFDTVPAYFVLDSTHEVVASNISFTAIEAFLDKQQHCLTY